MALVLLHSADDHRLWIDDSMVVSVMEAPGLGGATPNLVTMLSGSFFVRESAEDVAKHLGWKP